MGETENLGSEECQGRVQTSALLDRYQVDPGYQRELLEAKAKADKDAVDGQRRLDNKIKFSNY